MDSAEIALWHIEAAITLTDIGFIRNYLDAQISDASTGTEPPAVKTGRGRKPGAADESCRCTWKMQNGDLCKNAKISESAYCKTHLKRAALISVSDGLSSATVAASAVTTVSSAIA